MARQTKEALPELPPEYGKEDEAPPIPLHSTGGMVDQGMRFHAAPEVRIPIWEDSHRYNNGAYRVSVSRVTPEGITSSLGFMPADSSEDNVIARGQGAPGTYLVMPVDEHGEALRQQPYRRTVDAQHPAVMRYVASTASGVGNSQMAMMAAPSGGMSPEMLGFFQNVLLGKDAERDEIRADMRARDSEINRVREASSKMQLAVATDHTRNALSVQQSMLDADRARQDHVRDRELEQQKERAAADTASREAEAERAQTFYGAMLAQQRVAAEADQARRDDEAKRREEDLRRREMQMLDDAKRRDSWAREQERSRMERAERERSRDQEHMKLMVSLLEKQHAASDPFAALTQMIERTGPLKEMLPQLFGSAPTAPQGVMGLITTVVTEGMRTFTEMQRIQAGSGELEPEDAGLLEQMPMSPELQAQLSAAGQMPMLTDQGVPMTEDQIFAVQQQQAQAQHAQAAHAEQQRRMAAFASPTASVQALTPAAPTDPGVGAPAQVVDAQVVVAPPTFDPGAVVVALPDAVKRVPPVVRKKAREAIREMVATLKKLPKVQWQGAITASIMQTPQVIAYITAATIRAAMMEGGADAEFAAQVVASIDASGLVPATIPRG